MWLRSDGEFRIDDKPFPRGEIVLAGPCVFGGYMGVTQDNQDLQESTGEKNVYATGDVGVFNFITGELEIIDRLSSIVKLSHGEFVQLSKVETIVQSAKGV